MLMKRFTGILLIGFFILTSFCSGCDSVYRVLQKEGAEEKDLLGSVLPFEPNPAVLKVQKLLKLYGYNPGALDGKMGVNTRNAVQKFQQENQLPDHRFVDHQTWATLNQFGRSGLVINGQVNPRKVQAALLYSHSGPGMIDGKMGEKSKQALREFQKNNGLKADGKIGFKTLNKLNQYLPAPIEREGEAVAAQ